MTLHDELGRLADTAPRPTIDHSLWEQGRALRRRDRLVSSAVVLALVVVLGGVAALVLTPQRSVDPADGTVPGGAIPSVIRDVPADADLPLETNLAIGRASVAFVSSSGAPVVIGADDGEYHLVDLPDLPPGDGSLTLSPDGALLAWESAELIKVADLRSGEVTDIAPPSGRRPVLSELRWEADSANLVWLSSSGATAGVIDVTTTVERALPRGGAYWQGIESPDSGLFAIPTTELTAFVRFQRDSCCSYRTLPKDLYPDGAVVTPLGWADDHLVVAQAWSTPGSYVEGQHLVLFTSPDRPESEWTYRILARELPDEIPLSVAVDLIPDLDGTSSQQLTHDFGEPDFPGDSPWRDRLPAILGGLAALLAGLAYIRMLRRQ